MFRSEVFGKVLCCGAGNVVSRIEMLCSVLWSAVMQVVLGIVLKSYVACYQVGQVSLCSYGLDMWGGVRRGMAGVVVSDSVE